MDWLDNYQDDHKAVLLLLAKLEGNLQYLKSGTETPNVYAEFREFADVVKNVIIPHFKSEETGIYKDIRKLEAEGTHFADDMIKEHNVLYPLFERFVTAVEAEDKEKLIEAGDLLIQVLSHHILKEEDEMPRLFTVMGR